MKPIIACKMMFQGLLYEVSYKRKPPFRIALVLHLAPGAIWLAKIYHVFLQAQGRVSSIGLVISTPRSSKHWNGQLISRYPIITIFCCCLLSDYVQNRGRSYYIDMSNSQYLQWTTSLLNISLYLNIYTHFVTRSRPFSRSLTSSKSLVHPPDSHLDPFTLKTIHTIAPPSFISQISAWTPQSSYPLSSWSSSSYSASLAWRRCYTTRNLDSERVGRWWNLLEFRSKWIRY